MTRRRLSQIMAHPRRQKSNQTTACAEKKRIKRWAKERLKSDRPVGQVFEENMPHLIAFLKLAPKNKSYDVFVFLNSKQIRPGSSDF